MNGVKQIGRDWTLLWQCMNLYTNNKLQTSSFKFSLLVGSKRFLSQALSTSLCLQGLVPFYVNATAGTTVYGAFDPLDDIADVCHRHSLWMHVDVRPTIFFSLSPFLHEAHQSLLHTQQSVRTEAALQHSLSFRHLMGAVWSKQNHYQQEWQFVQNWSILLSPNWHLTDRKKMKVKQSAHQMIKSAWPKLKNPGNLWNRNKSLEKGLGNE